MAFLEVQLYEYWVQIEFDLLRICGMIFAFLIAVHVMTSHINGGNVVAHRKRIPPISRPTNKEQFHFCSEPMCRGSGLKDQRHHKRRHSCASPHTIASVAGRLFGCLFIAIQVSADMIAPSSYDRQLGGADLMSANILYAQGTPISADFVQGSTSPGKWGESNTGNFCVEYNLEFDADGDDDCARRGGRES